MYSIPKGPDSHAMNPELRVYLGGCRAAMTYPRPNEWIEALPYRAETKNLARKFLTFGRFKGSYSQAHLLSISILAKDAGVSKKTAERFFTKMVEDGYLLPAIGTPLDERFPRKLTYLYNLSVPTPPKPIERSPLERMALDAFVADTDGWVGVDWERDYTWQTSPSSPPPAWA